MSADLSQILTFRTPRRGLMVTNWRRCGTLGAPGNFSGAQEGPDATHFPSGLKATAFTKLGRA